MGRYGMLAAVVAVGMLLGGCAGPDPAGSAPADSVDTDVAGDEAADEAPDVDRDEAGAGSGQGSDSGPAVDGTLEVHFVDVGQGDATLLVHDDVTMLVDASDWQRTDVVDYLAGQGVDHLDVVAITHPHADHIGQFGQVMESVTVDEVWWSSTATTSQTFERALAALEASDAAYEEPRAGDSTTIGPLTIDVVGPEDDANFGDVNDSSLSLRVTYGDVSFLFTGDAEGRAEQHMASRRADQTVADVYQVGHHGSDTSTTGPLLDVLAGRLQVAVVSVGATNSYGHPSDSVLARMEHAGADIYRTDRHGTVVVTTDGTDLTVATSSGAGPDAGVAPGTAPDPDPEPEPGSDVTDHGAVPADGCVDLNSADLDLLQDIVHIGDDRAAAIVQGRPWTSVGDLSSIDGLGPGRLADITDQGMACVH